MDLGCGSGAFTNFIARAVGEKGRVYANESLDLVSMVTVLQEIPERCKALQEIKRILKPDGFLAVTEFLVDPDYPLKSTSIKICSAAGFILDEILGNIWNYTIRFKKVKNPVDKSEILLYNYKNTDRDYT